MKDIDRIASDEFEIISIGDERYRRFNWNEWYHFKGIKYLPVLDAEDLEYRYKFFKAKESYESSL
jgi:hypothetical protein